jgi:hypothetical protein
MGGEAVYESASFVASSVSGSAVSSSSKRSEMTSSVDYKQIWNRGFNIANGI